MRERDGRTYFTPSDEPAQTAQGERIMRIFKEPGARIIAEDLGVSVVPVREAIRRLEAEGLVKFDIHKGRWQIVVRVQGQKTRVISRRGPSRPNGGNRSMTGGRLLTVSCTMRIGSMMAAAIALQHKAKFAPGDDWQYSNTNYVVAGLIIEKVTHHSYAEELDRRVIKRIGLRHTYFPTPREETIREAHPKGYLQEKPGGPLRDVTEMDPSWTWAAGQLVSTNSDLDRFYSKLLTGHLLKKPQLDQMRTTVKGADQTFGPGARYGLGLVSKPLPCRPGEVYWGHGGSFPGYETRGGATADGRAANVAVTTQPTDKTVMTRVDKVVEKALCH